MTTNRLAGMAIFALLAGCAPAGAHPVPFSYVDVKLQSQTIEVTMVAHVFDVAHDLGVDPPERLLEPATLAARGADVIALLGSRLQIAADGKMLPAAAWSAPEALAERQSLKLAARYSLQRPAGSVAVTGVVVAANHERTWARRTRMPGMTSETTK